MRQVSGPVRCPMCGRQTTWRENPHRPFCSARCRLADLEGWLTGRYVVPDASDESTMTHSPPESPEDSTTSSPGEKT
jgi:uncharacterized protein